MSNDTHALFDPFSNGVPEVSEAEAERLRLEETEDLVKQLLKKARLGDPALVKLESYSKMDPALKERWARTKKGPNTWNMYMRNQYKPRYKAALIADAEAGRTRAPKEIFKEVVAEVSKDYQELPDGEKECFKPKSREMKEWGKVEQQQVKIAISQVDDMLKMLGEHGYHFLCFIRDSRGARQGVERAFISTGCANRFHRAMESKELGMKHFVAACDGQAVERVINNARRKRKGKIIPIIYPLITPAASGADEQNVRSSSDGSGGGVPPSASETRIGETSTLMTQNEQRTWIRDGWLKIFIRDVPGFRTNSKLPSVPWQGTERSYLTRRGLRMELPVGLAFQDIYDYQRRKGARQREKGEHILKALRSGEIKIV